MKPEATASVKPPGDLEAPRSTIQSLDRGLQLMEILSQSDDPMGLPELAEILEVDRSTVHRLMSTLLQRGYVTQDPENKRYTVGYKVISLSRRAIDGYSLRVTAKPFLTQLTQETGESSNLCVPSGDNAVCIDYEASPSPLAVTNDIGIEFLYHATAGGKVLLAYMPENKRTEIIDNYELTEFTPRTITTRERFISTLDTIRVQGYAVDDEEHFIGVRCIAAPIRDYSNKVIAALSMSGPSSRITLAKIPEISSIVIRIANEISQALGYNPESE